MHIKTTSQPDFSDWIDSHESDEYLDSLWLNRLNDLWATIASRLNRLHMVTSSDWINNSFLEVHWIDSMIQSHLIYYKKVLSVAFQQSCIDPINDLQIARDVTRCADYCDFLFTYHCSGYCHRVAPTSPPQFHAVVSVTHQLSDLPPQTLAHNTYNVYQSFSYA